MQDARLLWHIHSSDGQLQAEELLCFVGEISGRGRRVVEIVQLALMFVCTFAPQHHYLCRVVMQSS